jgi:enoyl-CoA hydratase
MADMTQAVAGEPPILVERVGAVARLWHNRPGVRNAENTALLDAFAAALDEAVADPEIRVIVLAGKGDHFSAGHDLKEAIAERTGFSVEQRWAYEEVRYYGYALKLFDCPKPTIAQIQGACVAGAFMLANMCDLVVAAEDAFFADPVAQSLGAASVEVLVHPWVMGLRRAKEMLFTGERMDAQEAHRIGMVNRVVPRAELDRATMDLAAKIGRAPPFALALTKRSLNRTVEMQGFRTALAAHFDTHQLSHVTAEAQAIRAAGAASAISTGRDKAGSGGHR